MTLLDLAERVEAASGADVWLDADIRDALKLESDYSVEWTGWGYDDAGKAIERPKAYPYTASLDAAMSLIDDNAYWRLGNDGEGPDPAMFKATVTSDTPLGGLIFHDGTAATPELAFTAAALRARAQVRP